MPPKGYHQAEQIKEKAECPYAEWEQHRSTRRQSRRMVSNAASSWGSQMVASCQENQPSRGIGLMWRHFLRDKAKSFESVEEEDEEPSIQSLKWARKGLVSCMNFFTGQQHLNALDYSNAVIRARRRTPGHHFRTFSVRTFWYPWSRPHKSRKSLHHHRGHLSYLFLFESFSLSSPWKLGMPDLFTTENCMQIGTQHQVPKCFFIVCKF